MNHELTPIKLMEFVDQLVIRRRVVLITYSSQRLRNTSAGRRVMNCSSSSASANCSDKSVALRESWIVNESQASVAVAPSTNRLHPNSAIVPHCLIGHCRLFKYLESLSSSINFK